MSDISYMSNVDGLIKFQERVLSKGKLNCETVSLEEVQDWFDFNQIFLNNVDEMFEKYDCTQIADEYVQLLREYNANIDEIITRMGKLIPKSFNLHDTNSDKRLMTEKMLHRRVMEASVHNIDGIEAGLYFIRCDQSKTITLVQLDESVYRQMFETDDHYWKTDECIIEYLNNSAERDTNGFTFIKITSRKGHISKIEWNGDSDNIDVIRELVNRDVLIVENRFLFIDDIRLVLDKFIRKQARPKLRPYESFNMTQTDMLVEYPNDSFWNYLNLLESSVNNPETKSISLTLYRIGDDPTLFNILKKGAENGIEINVNIELKASGEWINQFWFNEMRRSGMNVYTYKCGVMKVHSKLTLIEYHNGTKIAQIGTGNYHIKTTKQYTDLSFITVDQEICKCVRSVFDMLMSDGSTCHINNDFLVTGVDETNIWYLCKLIDEQGKLGTDGYICIKCNALSNRRIIRHLHRAAMSGCTIILLVRGICTWIPRFNNVTVKSVVWGKLEHSRVYMFGRSNPTVYIGSLDLVTRKIRHRIEVLIRIKDPDIIIDLCTYMNRYLTDIKNSWLMRRDGSYTKIGG